MSTTPKNPRPRGQDDTGTNGGERVRGTRGSLRGTVLERRRVLLVGVKVNPETVLLPTLETAPQGDSLVGVDLGGPETCHRRGPGTHILPPLLS